MRLKESTWALGLLASTSSDFYIPWENLESSAIAWDLGSALFLHLCLRDCASHAGHAQTLDFSASKDWLLFAMHYPLDILVYLAYQVDMPGY